MTMVTSAIVMINGEASIDVSGQQLIQAADDDELCAAGEDLDAIRIAVESCFRQLFPDATVEVMFPELGEMA